MKVVIADDEPLARERLRTLLATEPDLEVIGECVNGREAIAAVKKQRPDLLFLDIQMPEVDGFQALAQLAAPLPAVIFVTAFDEHAVKAFEVHALDYLLKPFKPARLRAAIARARDWPKRSQVVMTPRNASSNSSENAPRSPSISPASPSAIATKCVL